MNVPRMDVPENIRQFHALFEQLSQAKFTLDYCRMDAWRVFIGYRRDEPFTLDDLRLVWRYLKKQIINGKRNPGALKFRNLIQSPDYFEEDLIEARGDYERSNKPPIAVTKVVKYADTERIVANTGMEQVPFDTAKFFAELRAKL